VFLGEKKRETVRECSRGKLEEKLKVVIFLHFLSLISHFDS
jgi:hypothetical protein